MVELADLSYPNGLFDLISNSGVRFDLVVSPVFFQSLPWSGFFKSSQVTPR